MRQDLLSDISFGIVELLDDREVPKDKLPYVPGFTDAVSVRNKCESNIPIYGR